MTAESVDRKVEYGAATNDSGRYVTPFLPPGAYVTRFGKDRFRALSREGLQLSAVDRVNLNVQMQLGSLSEQVTVTAVRTGTIHQKLIADMSTAGRNLFQFQYTLPGVTKTSNYWGNFELSASGNMNRVSINGGRSGENEVLLDGVTSTRGNRGASFAPALQAIEEVNVITNTYDAQYGRVGDGTTSINIRSGTNQFHGELFEFFKNEKLVTNG